MLSIWNPAAKEIKQIEVPKDQIHESVRPVVGFGFSANLNDYKIVMIHLRDQNRIFSLRRGMRGETRVGTLDFDVFNGERAVCADGMLFWSAYTWNLCHCLVSFDIDNEVFSKIELPASIGNKNDVQLTLYKYSIAVLHHSFCPLVVDVWVMDKKSATGESSTWIKLLTVRPGSPLYRLTVWRGSTFSMVQFLYREYHTCRELSANSPLT
ncbi:hypothetical protein L6164_023372 [Bauhinia variegata]|uniref:Uncharacterized protein n=1 Tax=Bauhinia variegata TaxID=167791 RepID=A0ACB9MJX7_BAUVA|nr:hypothetical protein L6164_023372 [Bauhinia variegata]